MHLPRTCRSCKQNTHLVTPGQIPPAQPIIGLPALLRLVEWYKERRRNTQQGGFLCVNLKPPLSPPAPQQNSSATESSADMDDSCRQATRTDSSALTRGAAQQLAKPPDVKEVTHDRS